MDGLMGHTQSDFMFSLPFRTALTLIKANYITPQAMDVILFSHHRHFTRACYSRKNCPY